MQKNPALPKCEPSQRVISTLWHVQRTRIRAAKRYQILPNRTKTSRGLNLFPKWISMLLHIQLAYTCVSEGRATWSLGAPHSRLRTRQNRAKGPSRCRACAYYSFAQYRGLDDTEPVLLGHRHRQFRLNTTLRTFALNNLLKERENGRERSSMVLCGLPGPRG